MTISELTLKSSVDIDEPARRFEIFTGAGRRRDWCAEAKSWTVEERFEAGRTGRAGVPRATRSPADVLA